MSSIDELFASVIEEAESSAERWRKWRTGWKSIHYLVGVIGSIAGVVASAAALEETAPALTVAGALIAAAAVALQTLLKPGAWSKHNQEKFADAHKLAADAKVERTRLSGGHIDRAEALDRLMRLTERMRVLNASQLDV